jgi:SAM-dependent methyltransferase
MTSSLHTALVTLGDYLRDISFPQIYKRIAGLSRYYKTPHVFNQVDTREIQQIVRELLGAHPEYSLSFSLATNVLMPLDALAPSQRAIATLLHQEGLIAASRGWIGMGSHQLISAFDKLFLIDAEVNFPSGHGVNVYIGRDSYRLASFVDTSSIRPTDGVLDIGTGSGIVALHLSSFASDVTATDISMTSVRDVEMNAVLNLRQDGFRIVREDIAATLSRPQGYHVLCMNPPFLATPEGLLVPQYASGPGLDGLNYCRQLLNSIRHTLHESGVAYIYIGLPGDASGPFFLDELRGYSSRLKLKIEVFADSSEVLEFGCPFFALRSNLLHMYNPDTPLMECQSRLESLYFHTLAATVYHYCLLKVRPDRLDHSELHYYGAFLDQ